MLRWLSLLAPCFQLLPWRHSQRLQPPPAAQHPSPIQNELIGRSLCVLAAASNQSLNAELVDAISIL
jgi:hypothetical protein